MGRQDPGEKRRSLNGHGDGNANGTLGARDTPGTETKSSMENLAQGPGLVARKTAQGSSSPRVSGDHHRKFGNKH